MLNVAIVGLGTVSPLHKDAINKDSRVKLVAVCDILMTNKERYDNVHFYSNIDEMLKNEKIDCVHICLPHYLHIPTIKKCAEYRVNIFTEKPLSLNYEEAEEIFGIESKYGIKVGVCLQNRYNNTTIKIKKITDSGEYGKLVGIKSVVTWSRDINYYKNKPWRGTMSKAGGGVMINQTIHTLDIMQYIAGDPKKINGKILNFTMGDSIEVEDTATAYIVFNNGVKGLYFATNAYCINSSVEMEFVFDNARIVLQDNALYLYADGERKEICKDIKMEGSKHYYGSSHIIAIKEFYTAIINNNDDYINVREASKSIRMIDLIRKSSNKNKMMEEL